MAAKIICVAQQKGGAGKTTLCAHLAVALAAGRRSVAVLDIDPQQSLTTWYRQREELFGDDGAGLAAESLDDLRTSGQVKKLAKGRDILIIDCPPHAGNEARIAMRNADLVVVPVQPSPMDVWATRPTLELAAREGVPVLMVLNRVPARANLTDEMLAAAKAYGVKIARTRVGNRVLFAGALNEGLTAGEMAPSGRAANEIERLAREVLRLAG
ncbi:MAG TPA: ParA family partition ATPase [Kiloniellales bacterium]